VLTASDLDEDWRKQSPTRFAVARGDFDGDGKPDEARLMLSRAGKRLALVVRLSTGGERVIEEWDRRALKRHGVVTLPPGRYRTACGKGYFECGPREPEELVTRWDGIDFFYEESADGVYYMTKSGSDFVYSRLSD